MTRDLEQEARFIAAHHNLHLAVEWGLADGTAIMRGNFVGTLRSLIAVQGYGPTLDLIREHLGKPLGEVSRPYLAVSNEVEIRHPRGAV